MVLAQRLVRRICPHCRKPAKVEAGEIAEAGLDPDQYRDHEFFEGEGCKECRGMGFLGRSAIVEMLELSDDMRELILTKAPVTQLKKAASAAGTVFLREAAVEKVLEGVTTFREINRVTFVERG
jgi:type IV pilus assembly protein PilB